MRVSPFHNCLYILRFISFKAVSVLYRREKDVWRLELILHAIIKLYRAESHYIALYSTNLFVSFLPLLK
jgi:hypothetical protein